MHETNDPRSRGASFAARFLIVALCAVHPAAVSAASPDESVLGFTARRSQDVSSTLIRSAWRSSYAFGDFDADGRDEIAIGIPFATVDGKRAAGRVVILDDTPKEGPSSLDARLTSLLDRSEIDIPRARCTAVRVLPDRSLELDLQL